MPPSFGVRILLTPVATFQTGLIKDETTGQPIGLEPDDARFDTVFVEIGKTGEVLS